MSKAATWETTAQGATRVSDGDRLIQNQADLFAWVQRTFAGEQPPRARANGQGAAPAGRETDRRK